jgi:hypothetical protein
LIFFKNLEPGFSPMFPGVPGFEMTLDVEKTQTHLARFVAVAYIVGATANHSWLGPVAA